MENDNNVHKRRVRYKGKNPRTYAERYKELNPSKYKDTIDKVIQKGNTPVGMHRPICVDEIMDFLDIKENQIGIDATLGYGGHTEEILKRLNKTGHLYATDVDPLELPKTTSRINSLGYTDLYFTSRNMNYSDIKKIISEVGQVNFIIADLGVSSMQIDNPERGFSYKTEGPLDLRLNPSKGISAADRLKTISQEELQGMLLENADEPHAAEIARAITSSIKKGTDILTTNHLRQMIKDALEFLPAKEREAEIKKSCQRCFQALRIDVNHEFEVLYEFLEKLPAAMAEGGRVAILTFHSGEDRLVKKSFRHFYREGIYREIAPEAIRPSAAECNSNSRARSAKLRWAIKS